MREAKTHAMATRILGWLIGKIGAITAREAAVARAHSIFAEPETKQRESAEELERLLGEGSATRSDRGGASDDGVDTDGRPGKRV